MKIRQFTALVGATAVMATGVVLAPADSALDLTVRGDVCTLQATAQDRQDFRQAVAATRSDVVRGRRRRRLRRERGAGEDPGVSPQVPARNRLPDGRNGGGDPEPGSGQK